MRIDETLDQLSGCKWFSTLDLHSGHWQIEMDAQDKAKTVFVTRDGLLNSMLCLSGYVMLRLLSTG